MNFNMQNYASKLYTDKTPSYAPTTTPAYEDKSAPMPAKTPYDYFGGFTYKKPVQHMETSHFAPYVKTNHIPQPVYNDDVKTVTAEVGYMAPQPPVGYMQQHVGIENNIGEANYAHALEVKYNLPFTKAPAYSYPPPPKPDYVPTPPPKPDYPPTTPPVYHKTVGANQYVTVHGDPHLTDSDNPEHDYFLQAGSFHALDDTGVNLDVKHEDLDKNGKGIFTTEMAFTFGDQKLQVNRQGAPTIDGKAMEAGQKLTLKDGTTVEYAKDKRSMFIDGKEYDFDIKYQANNHEAFNHLDYTVKTGDKGVNSDGRLGGGFIGENFDEDDKVFSQDRHEPAFMEKHRLGANTPPKQGIAPGEFNPAAPKEAPKEHAAVWGEPHPLEDGTWSDGTGVKPPATGRLTQEGMTALQDELDSLASKLKETPEGSPDAAKIEARMNEIREFMMVA